MYGAIKEWIDKLRIITQRGAIPALPTKKAVHEYLAKVAA
ncbi:hypothetical protein SLEP1_g58942 [Rubroshorea leprosula]|uniref:Uncharacterized protein n=1 Tax=Rubroshorea leprosula TaxID=152421 RepID=A0AAV5MRZ5_9ROSI|nr:hypothetical protein SLEP1_g58942 [Rubroshorea leprosula]